MTDTPCIGTSYKSVNGEIASLVLGYAGNKWGKVNTVNEKVL